MKHTIILFVMAAISATLWANEVPKQFSVEQAELLARTAAQGVGTTKLKGFSLERAQLDQFPEFYFFDALVSEPGAEGFSGHYAVNKFTGEVWDPYRCLRFSDAHLLKVQRQMRKEIGLSAQGLRQRRKDEPPCLAGEH